MSDTITITGNVATDPDYKRTDTGMAITKFRVASAQRRFDSAADAWVETGTNWYAISVFRGLAEHAYASLKRGDRVILTGRLRIRDWENGSKRGTAVEIDAEAIGHDLRWGTSSFTKTARATGTVDRDDSSGPAVSPADRWAEPGVSAPGSEAWSAGAEPTPLLEAVGAETPY